MATLNQLVKGVRSRKFHKTKRRELRQCPHKKGTCLRVYQTTPRKPNSAIRKVARVLLTSTLRSVTAYIPGIGHNLQKHSTVLIRGGRVKDLPGMKYKIIRGKYDAKRLEGRTNRRSKYGTKNLARLR